jgi:K+-transporting ATPase ATPase B chain
VVFANFAEAMAEGRGKAQADTLRKARSETMARRLKREWQRRKKCPVRSARRRRSSGDAGEFIPGDGEVIEGVASVDESAITG